MFPDLLANDVQSVVKVLSAMITPTVLILASGSLIMTTSSRAIRCVDRVREMAAELETAVESPEGITPAKRELLYDLLQINTRRARLLQRAMSRLYVAISFFVATSVSIGVVALTKFNAGWIPLLLGFIGAGLLFSATVYLIIESRSALATTYAEMDYINRNYMR